MAKNRHTLIVVATYNEIENLPELVEAIFRFAPQADLLVIDDHSPDGTGQWCDRYAAREPRFRCHHRPGKLGLGSATRAGLQDALDQGYARVITMDADFSHDPRFLPDLEACLEDDPAVDVVIGSRYVPGGGIQGWPLHRRLMSRAINAYARWLLGLPVADCSGAFRLYRTEALRRADLEQWTSQGYSYLEESLWRLQRSGARFAETPILFVDRRKGQTKISWREAAAAVWITARLAFQRLRA